jgi:hypothetical protein
MTEAAAIKEAAAINEEMLDALLVIHRIARRALSDEERIGQWNSDLAARSNDPLQMAAITDGRAGCEGREFLIQPFQRRDSRDPRRGAEDSLISFRAQRSIRGGCAKSVRPLVVIGVRARSWQFCAPILAASSLILKPVDLASRI